MCPLRGTRARNNERHVCGRLREGGGNDALGLDGLLDESGAEAAGADPDAFGSAVDQGSDGLKVRGEDAPRFVVGMADSVA